jgi:glucose dehydrogenase
MFANRNGFYYTLDRTTGKLIVAKPVREHDRGRRVDLATGRPILLPGHEPDEKR